MSAEALQSAYFSRCPYVMSIIIELHPGVYGEDIKNRIVEAFKAFGFNMDEQLGDVYLFTRM